MNILLVTPQTPMTFWSLKHAVRFVARQAAFPPLGLLTVAAMLPKSWNLRVVDMDVTRLRDADLRWAAINNERDFVAKISLDVLGRSWRGSPGRVCAGCCQRNSPTTSRAWVRTI